MRNIITYFFSFAMFTSPFTYINGSQPHTQTTLYYCHGHHKLYDPKHLSRCANNNFLYAEDAYKKTNNHKIAAFFATGALAYADIMKHEMDSAPSPETIHIAHYIIADYYLHHTNSPQRALESLRRIHDIQTPYGVMTSKNIARLLHTKSLQCNTTNQQLTEKLEQEAHYYAITLPYQRYQQAIKTSNTHERIAALQQLQSIEDTQSFFRKFIIQSLDTKWINASTVEKFFRFELRQDFNTIINQFITSDGRYIIPLLKKQIIQKPHNIHLLHYIVGLLYYYQKNYAEAYTHLTATNLYKSDLPTQCKVFMAFTQTHTETSYNDALHAITMLEKMFQLKKKNYRTQTAIQQRITLLAKNALHYAHILIDNNDSERALWLALLCTQQEETYMLGLEIISLLHNNLVPQKQTKTVIMTSKAFECIKQHFITHQDPASLACLSPIITHSIISKRKMSQPSNLFTIQCIEHLLEHKTKKISHSSKQYLMHICKLFYYRLGTTESDTTKKIYYLNKAIHYKHNQAIVDLASILFTRKNRLNIFQLNQHTIDAMHVLHALVNLAKTPNLSPTTKMYAFDVLASIDYTIFVDAQNNPFIRFHDKETMFHYMSEGYALGSTKHLEPLARYYITGIRDTTNQGWFLKPNYDKAAEILEYLETFSSKIFGELAEAYFCEGPFKNHKKAFDLLSTIVEKSTITSEQCNALLYMSAIKLHTATVDSMAEALSLYKKAIKINKKAVGHLTKLITKELYAQLYACIEPLIIANNNDKTIIDLCSFLGQVFFSTKFSVDPVLLPHAKQCLEYAAENNCGDAQYYIILNSPLFSHISRFKKIDYINAFLNNKFSTCTDVPMNDQIYMQLEQTFNTLLNVYHPKTLQEKYEYIQYLHSKNDKTVLEKYLASHHFASIQKKSAYIIPEDEAIAQTFYTDTILTPYIQEFKKKATKKTSSAHDYTLHAALLYAYALSHSNDPKLLTTSAFYFEAVNQFLINDTLKLTHLLLGTCFYKLGMHYQQEKPTLTCMYLVKAANLRHEQSVIALSTKWLAALPEANNINVQQLVSWLNAVKNETNKMKIEYTIDACILKNDIMARLVKK